VAVLGRIAVSVGVALKVAVSCGVLVAVEEGVKVELAVSCGVTL
jgi:hypothetical protein